MKIKTRLSFFNVRKSLFSKLFMTLVALFVFSFFMTIILWNTNMSKITERNSSSHVYDIIQSSNERFDEQLRIVTSYASVIQEMPETIRFLKTGTKSEVLDTALLNSFNSLSYYISGITVFDMNGNTAFAGLPYIHKNYKDMDWFKKTIENRGTNTFFIRDFFGKVNKSHMSVARSVVYGNEPIGIVLFDLKPEFFVKSFGTNRMNGNLRTIITDSESGTILYNSTSMVSNDLAEKIVAANQKNLFDSQAMSEVEVDGVSYMLMTQKSTYTGWTNITFLEKSVMENSYRSTLVTMLLYSLIFLLATVFSAILLFNILSGKMNNLTTEIAKIDLDSIDENPLEFFSGGNDEIGIISSKIASMLNKISAQVKEINTLSEERREIEFHTLRSQLNYHFLYNTLQVIVNLSKMQGANNICSVAESLIQLLHYSTDPTPGLVPISEEINYIKNYVFLMQHKFFRDIDVIYDIDEELLNCRTIKMLLQPVVENTIKYAFDGSDGEYILIKIQKRSDTDIEIIIADNGKGIPKKKLDKILDPEFTQSGHLGLSNLEKRIKLSFGAEYGINILSMEGLQTTVIIDIPYIDENNLSNGKF